MFAYRRSTVALPMNRRTSSPRGSGVVTGSPPASVHWGWVMRHSVGLVALHESRRCPTPGCPLSARGPGACATRSAGRADRALELVVGRLHEDRAGRSDDDRDRAV